MQLDSSHQIVLENLNTFQKAQRCLDEVEAHLQSVLREVADELSALHAPLYDFKVDNDGSTYLQTRAFPNMDNTGAHLITIGIERLTSTDLLGLANPEATRAYIYSELLNDPKRATNYPNMVNILRQLTPPDGFLAAAPQMHGYLFVKQLAPVPVPTVCSRTLLKSFFRQTLDVLTSWLITNTPQLSSLAGEKPSTPVISV